MTAIGRRGVLALAASAAFAPAARAEAGKRFITANNSGYDTLDPHTVFDIGRIGSRLNLYDCLVRWVGNPPELKLWLADRIDIAPDGVTYTVTIKQGAKFHDGSPIGADDAGIIPANLWGAPKDLQGYGFDLAKAKQHLAMVQAPMRQLEIGVLAGFDQSEAAAQLLQAGAAKIGIDIKLNTEPWPVVSGKLSDPDKTHDLVPLWRSAYFADPHNWTGYLYNSRNIGAGNSSFYRNAKFDALTDQALVLTKQEERQPLYEEASRILVEDAAGLFIYNTRWFGPFTRNVHDVRFCPIGDAQDIRWMSMT